MDPHLVVVPAFLSPTRAVRLDPHFECAPPISADDALEVHFDRDNVWPYRDAREILYLQVGVDGTSLAALTHTTMLSGNAAYAPRCQAGGERSACQRRPGRSSMQTLTAG
jgi:hypothetical protein